MYAHLGDIANSLRIIFREKHNATIFAVITALMFMLYTYLLSYSSIVLLPGPALWVVRLGKIITGIALSYIIGALICVCIHKLIYCGACIAEIPVCLYFQYADIP